MQVVLYRMGNSLLADHNCMSKGTGKEVFWGPGEFQSQSDDKDRLFGLWQRVRSPLQPHGRKAGLLQGLPSQAPETPVLMFTIFFLFNFE